jgi:hypothetical protein
MRLKNERKMTEKAESITPDLVFLVSSSNIFYGIPVLCRSIKPTFLLPPAHSISRNLLSLSYSMIINLQPKGST